MESFGLESGDFEKQKALLMAFTDADIEADVRIGGSAFSIEVPGVHRLEGVVREDELVIDYIESDGAEAGAAAGVMGALTSFAEESGYTVRASNVLPEAVDFWESLGFEKDGSDWVWEPE